MFYWVGPLAALKAVEGSWGSEAAHRAGITGVRVPASMIPGCVANSKSAQLSGPHFLHL